MNWRRCPCVYSLADPRVVGAQGEFLFVASDRVRSVRLVQDRHLDSIRAADFLWLVCPDGYVGQSASMEIGFAAGAGIPIFALRGPLDLTLREYVTVVPSLSEAVRRAEASPRSRCQPGILIDPHASIEEAHAVLEQLDAVLLREPDSSERAYFQLTELKKKLALPTYVQ